MAPLLQFLTVVRSLVALFIFLSSSARATDFSPNDPQQNRHTDAEFHTTEFSTTPQYILLPGGASAVTSAQITVTTDPSAMKLSKEETNAPIRKLLLAPSYADPGELKRIRSFEDEVSRDKQDVETMPIDELVSSSWFVRHHNTVYSLIRFTLNGVTIGSTLICALGVPPAKAILLGLLSGSISGLFQYNVDLYRDWALSNPLIDKFALPISADDGSIDRALKKIYNGTLDNIEEYGKLGVTEVGTHAISRLAMLAINVPGVLPGLRLNTDIIMKTAAQGTIAGTGVFGLFEDLKIQKEYSGWSDESAEIFQNTTTFLLSAIASGFSAIQLVNPSFSAAFDLGVIDLPVGFAAVAMIGVGFYAHAFYTYLGHG